MWYIESGNLKGTSYRKSFQDAIGDVLEQSIEETHHFPDLSELIAGSTVGFDAGSSNSIVTLTDWALQQLGKIPKTIDDPKEMVEDVLEMINDDPEKLQEILKTPRDAVLNEEYIDAPTSWDDFWPDEVEVPETFFTDKDASTSES